MNKQLTELLEAANDLLSLYTSREFEKIPQMTDADKDKAKAEIRNSFKKVKI